MRQDLYTQMYHQEEYYWWHKAKRALVKQFLPPNPHLRILDIGCGTGKLMQELSHFGSVWGIDSNAQAIAFCRSRGLKHVYQQRLPQIKLKHKFDVITCLDVLEHIADDVAALKNINQLLKPDGRLIFTVPAYPWLFSYWDRILGHHRRYNPSRLKQILSAARLKSKKITYVYIFLVPLVIPFRFLRQIVFARKVPQSDFINLPNWAHQFLFKLARVEQKLLGLINLPFGLSLLCIARK